MKILVTLITLLFFNAVSSIFGQESYSIPIEGGVLGYSTYGEGNPLLIINGGPGMDSRGFEDLAKSFSDDYQAILFDQRGTGRSELASIDSKSISMDKMVEDMEVLRIHLGLEQWNILGHSFGGMLASYYTSKHPENVNSLILSSSGGVDLSLLDLIRMEEHLTTNQSDSLQYWTQRYFDGDTSYETRYNRGLYMAPAYLYDKSYVPVIAERLTHVNFDVNTLVWSALRASDFNCKPALKDFAGPVLIVQGKNDLLPISIAVNTHELFSNSTLSIIDQCAHYGWLDQPDEYFKVTKGFLEKFQPKS